MAGTDQPTVSGEGTADDPPTRTAPTPASDAASPQMPGLPDPNAAPDDDAGVDAVGIDELLKELDSRAPAAPSASEGPLTGTIVNVRDDGFFVDIGRKSEAFLPREDAREGDAEAELAAGDEVAVSITGRSADGYLNLSRVIAERPKDWSQFEVAFEAGTPIAGTVSEVIKGGLAVDVGVRAFLPASRSGVRETADLEKLVGEEIRCRIAQLDVEDENVILDRRVLLEEEQEQKRRDRIASLEPGMTVTGTVRDLREFGAFVDLGGVDALLHVSDLAWEKVKDVSSVLNVGDSVEVKVLKVEQDGKRISVGRKHLTPDPWTKIGEKLEVGARVKGTVTKLMDFGAFVEIEPGVEGLIHISEMSWARRVRHPKDLLSVGDVVEVVVLEMKIGQRRIGLGLKQALGDPWADASKKFAPGTTVEGTVRNLTNFGAFIEVEAGVEGLLHVSDMVEDRHVNHPGEIVKVDQKVQVAVTGVDVEKRRLRLSMKALQPDDRDDFIEEHQVGDAVTGRVAKLSKKKAVVELGEGLQAVCFLDADAEGPAEMADSAPAKDVSSLGAMLQSAWKGDASSGDGADRRGEKLQLGQVRSFKITKLDAKKRTVELQLV